MSAGTKVYGIRIPEELAWEIEVAVVRRNRHARGVPWYFSDFVRIACAEKLAKMIRSRGGETTTRTMSDSESWIGDEERIVLPLPEQT